MAVGLPACATCGATSGTLVAPGWVSCGGTVEVQREELRLVGERPRMGDPFLGREPVYAMVPVTTVEPCPSRHHVPVTLPQVVLPRCACGTFAIGLCLLCDTPVCGDDSSREEGRRLCRGCRAEALAERNARAAEERRRRSEQPEVPHGRLGEQRSSLATCGHPWSQIAPDGRCWTCQPA